MAGDFDERADIALDELLDEARPGTTPVTAEIEDELARMTVASRTDTTLARRPHRRAGRIATAGLVAAVLLGGAGAAAAAVTGGFDSWWADEPDGSYSFVLPSGATCQAQWGGVMAATKDEPIRQAVRDYLASVQIKDIVNVDAEIVRMRADKDVWLQNDDGSQEPAWYGTENYKSPDQEYVQAVLSSVSGSIDEELERQGFDLVTGDGERGLTYEAEVSCPEGQF